MLNCDINIWKITNSELPENILRYLEAMKVDFKKEKNKISIHTGIWCMSVINDIAKLHDGLVMRYSGEASLYETVDILVSTNGYWEVIYRYDKSENDTKENK